MLIWVPLFLTTMGNPNMPTVDLSLNTHACSITHVVPQKSLDAPSWLYRIGPRVHTFSLNGDWQAYLMKSMYNRYHPSAQTNLTPTTLRFQLLLIFTRPLFVDDSDFDSYYDSYFLAEMKTTT